MLRKAVALLSLALLVAACGSARESARIDAEPRSSAISPQEVTTKIVGATPKQDTILREILAGLGHDTRIRSVYVRPDGKDGQSVAVDPHVASGKAVRGDWEVWLLANAFADRSRAIGLQRVTMLFVDGEAQSSLDSGDPVVPRDPINAEALSQQVVTGAKKSDARLAQLELLHPNNDAVYVKLQVDDPASFLDRRARAFLATVQTPQAARYDGLFIEVVDGNGKLAWSYSHAASEDGGETTWGYNRPELAGCDPIPSIGGSPFSAPPPPCPSGKPDVQVETVAPSDVTTKIVGGTPKQKAVLREILSGLGPTRLDSVEVVADIEKEWRAPSNAVGIDSKALKPDSYSSWQAFLVGELFGRRSLELRLPPVAYVGDNDGQSGGHDFSTDASNVPWTRADADRPIRRMAEIAKRYGASTRVRVLKPNRLAFAVDFRVERPAEFLQAGLRRSLKPLEEADEGRHDGLYIKVVDTKGRRVLETGRGVWVRPDLLGCSPYGRFGTPSDPPIPPCPTS